MNNAFSIIYAKQGDPNLRDLIELRSTAALPIAGRYRMIDILLSNIVHSGIRSVGLITQRNYNSLMNHLGSGKEWGLSKKSGGLTFLPPFDLYSGSELYHGFVDALLSKRDFITHQRWPYCLLMATDQVYRQNFDVMMDKLLEEDADIALMYSRADSLMDDRSGSTTFLLLDGDRVIDSSSQRIPDENCVANLRVCLMKKDLLLRLVEDTCAQGDFDFDTGLLKQAIQDYKVVGVEHNGYVGRVSSVESYFQLNKDMLDKNVRHDLFDPDFPVYTKTMDSPPTLFGSSCDVENSLFGTGCTINGKVEGSIVFRGVRIDEGADVENCIIMQNSHIGSGAKLCNMIIDKSVMVRPGARLISAPYNPRIVRKREIIEDDSE